MLLNKQIRKEKEYLWLNKRLFQLREDHEALGYELLEKPYQRGWYKTIRLKDFVLQKEVDDHMIEAFEKFKLRLWAKTKEKVDVRWEQYHQNRKISRLGAIKGIRLMNDYCFEKLDPNLQEYYSLYLTYQVGHRTKSKYKCNISPYKYEVFYERAIITYTKVIDESILQEISEIENKLDHAFISIRCRKHSSWYKGYSNKLSVSKARKHNKQLLKTLTLKIPDSFNFKPIIGNGW